ncbi:response regulator transcription factor [Hansschlegelia sp.]|uniref:response regulator transcription factor n=1 Tax=Hansschlegelia sp. TaxID=2041892 RepID=UPI002CEC5ECF|nr:response regulator transcription factor [Hansschlegelia sp.]HVI27882.1 response regulator transcription factor [Hansschlegelia sp.]
MRRLTAILVDDHPVVRAGYRKLLERQADYKVTGEAGTVLEAYHLYKKVQPDIVVMDISMPGSSGLEGIRRIRAYDGRAKILVFSMHQSVNYALKAFEAGASGYVTKSSPSAELIACMGTVMRGGRSVSDDIARMIAAERVSGRASPIDGLGPREVEILQLLAAGNSTEEAAAALQLSHKTVQNYHSVIKAKLNASNDAKLVWIALGAGLLEPPDFEN